MLIVRIGRFYFKSEATSRNKSYPVLLWTEMQLLMVTVTGNGETMVQCSPHWKMNYPVRHDLCMCPMIGYKGIYCIFDTGLNLLQISTFAWADNCRQPLYLWKKKSGKVLNLLRIKSIVFLEIMKTERAELNKKCNFIVLSLFVVEWQFGLKNLNRDGRMWS